MSLKDDKVKHKVIELGMAGYSKQEISTLTGVPRTTISDFLNQNTFGSWWDEYNDLPLFVDESPAIGDSESDSPFNVKIALIDIETAPIQASVWRLFKENIGLNQIEQDWYVLSWCGKWLGEDKVFYESKEDSWDNEKDKELLQNIWKMLDEADIVIGQNSKRFDEKKLNARFILNGMKPPSSYRSIDTLEIAKRHFGFTSNKLEYMTDKLCKKYKKLKHGKFAGFLLWKECMAGNPEAWAEMEEYNIHDVLSLEELYTILRPWYKAHPNMNTYHDSEELICKCGNDTFEHNGYSYSNLGKYDRFACTACNAEVKGRVNLLSKEKRASLKGNII